MDATSGPGFMPAKSANVGLCVTRGISAAAALGCGSAAGLSGAPCVVTTCRSGIELCGGGFVCAIATADIEKTTATALNIFIKLDSPGMDWRHVSDAQIALWLAFTGPTHTSFPLKTLSPAAESFRSQNGL